MRKFYLFLLLVFMAESISAQTPTVSTSSVTFRYCQPTSSEMAREIYSYEFPYIWNFNGVDVEFTKPDTINFSTPNVRGCDSVVTLAVTVEDGAIPFAFSVSATKKVYFSKGNLQYCANPSCDTKTHATRDGEHTQGIWRFAEQQWQTVKDGGSSSPVYVMGSSTIKSSNTSRSSTSSGWIDLFKFGANGYGYLPYSAGRFNFNYCDVEGTVVGYSTIYQKTNLDFGWYNAISNGGNVTERWYMLTNAEWNYLINQRSNASKKRGAARINNILMGYVLLPDNWTLPSGCEFTEDGMYNAYTFEQWTLMEQNGAVFLPATCWIQGDGYNTNPVGAYQSSDEDVYGYWTSTKGSDNVDAGLVRQEYPNKIGTTESDTRHLYAVRLVCDIPQP